MLVGWFIFWATLCSGGQTETFKDSGSVWVGGIDALPSQLRSEAKVI
jgi:hypothetical protein